MEKLYNFVKYVKSDKFLEFIVNSLILVGCIIYIIFILSFR